MAREYHFYIGEQIGTVGLWKEYDDDYGDEETPHQFTKEYPIFQNTRGRGIWNSNSSDETTMNRRDPTDEFWRGLAKIAAQGPKAQFDFDGEWYEAEVIQSIIDLSISLRGEAMPSEVGGLLVYAEEGRWKGGEADD
jgi:hypothetical protein